MKEFLKIITSDGFVLAATRFIPQKPNGKVVLINAATGVKQTYYSDFASFLACQGFHVYTYDYRGIGQSRPAQLRNFKASMKDWGMLDYHCMLQNLAQTHPQSRIAVVGHSVGGQLIGFSPLSAIADTIVMVGAQTPFWKKFPGFWMSIRLYLFWFMIIPFLTRLAGYFPASKLGLFEDLPAQVALQWARWAKSSNYIFDEMPGMKRRFSALQQNALMVSFTDDALAPAAAVEDLMKRYTQLKWDHWHIKPDDLLQKQIGHFGFFKKRMQPTLWAEAVKWLGKPQQHKESKAA
jgi:predicted alpha/beta hydrolase